MSRGAFDAALAWARASELRDYPMPPADSDLDGPVLRAAAKRLGWNVRAVPLAINTEPRHGRPFVTLHGINEVPILTLTLSGGSDAGDGYLLRQQAVELAAELKAKRAAGERRHGFE